MEDILIADTTFLIDLLKNQQDAVKLFNKYGDHIHTTIINVFELYVGMNSSNSINIERLVDYFVIHSIDIESSKLSAHIKVTLKENGEEIDSEDCLIAGTALIKNCRIITRNVKHFSRIPGLKIIKY